MASMLMANELDSEFLKREPAGGPLDRPQALFELDVNAGVLEDLALKTLYLSGSLSVLDLSEKLCLSYNVSNEIFARLRAELCCQVTGMLGNVPQIAITAAGRTRAADLLSQSRYVGPAPVSFKSYVEQVRKQSVKKVSVHAPDVARAFADLVVDNQTLRQLGTALNSGSSLFLYGPPGTGKTTIAERLSRVLAEDEVWIPHAVEADGQIITLYDSAVHKGEPVTGSEANDARWVRCQRPAVLVGGELTAEMLDLQFNPVSKFYVGPVQMKANNGVLIIDDFGRQRLRPEELLNRWIVPLDRRIDFLTMSGGKKIEIPFEMLVVFASNFEPSDLVDPAFIRRIKTKIRIGACTDEQFCEIFNRVANQNRVKFDATIPKDLLGFVKYELKQELRSCYPRDIVEQVCWAARFDNKEPYIDRPALTQAIRAYFVMERPKAAAPANA
jgi:predicted ATPase with chaperone activity